MMSPVGVSLVSRAAEWAAIQGLLRDAGARTAGLVLAGSAGMGKTTLWLAGLDLAREHGFLVLSARASPAESAMAYTAVSDLLADVEPDVYSALPDIQQLALKRILLQTDDDVAPATDQRVAAAAVVTVIEALAAHTPVVLAIDDGHWLDASSRAVIAFAARRLSGRIGLLLTERTESDGRVGSDWLQLGRPEALSRVQMGPMTLAGLHEVLMGWLGRTYPRPTLVRIAEASGGNPLYAVELARAIDGQRPHSPLVLPATLAELMQLRTGRFDEPTQHMLLAASCVINPTVNLIAAATSVTPERAVELLETPEREGIVTIEGNRVRFAHPLLARGAYTYCGAASRRRMHRALADIEVHPEIRARHLALGATHAEPEVVLALDTAADTARARGAPAVSAELLELAIGLGADTPARRIRAAKHCLHGGDADRALALLEPALTELPPGPLRAAAAHVHSGILTFSNSFARAAEVLNSAVPDAEGDEHLQAQMHLGLAMALGMSGRIDDAIHHASEAVHRAEIVGEVSLISQALSMEISVRCVAGYGVDPPALHRALRFESPDVDVPIAFRASAVDALMKLWTGQLEHARTQFREVHRRCLERGAETDLIWLAGHRFFAELWSGDYGAAEAMAGELMQRGQQLGSAHATIIATYQYALVAAYRGRESEARAGAMSAITAAAQHNASYLMLWPAMALVFLDTSLGNYTDALATMGPLLTRLDPPTGASEMFTSSFVPDAIEALIGVGRADDAEQLIVAMETNGERLDRPWALAVGARGRAMQWAANGDLKRAAVSIAEAMAHHAHLSMPFETARTQVLLGQIQRRQRQTTLAVATFAECLQTFEKLGTTTWAARARRELARTKVGRNHDQELTPSERRVAELASSGRTNRDIAAALFISPKTVEQNITRIYRKLGIANRAELARRIHVEEQGKP